MLLDQAPRFCSKCECVTFTFWKKKILGSWLTVFETMKHWQFDILIGSYAKIPVTQLKQDLVPRYWVCYLVKYVELSWRAQGECLVGEGVAIGIRRFPVQTPLAPLDPCLTVGTKHRHETRATFGLNYKNHSD